MTVITKSTQGIPDGVNKANDLKSISAPAGITKESMTKVPEHTLPKVGPIAATATKAKLNKGGTYRVG